MSWTHRISLFAILGLAACPDSGGNPRIIRQSGGAGLDDVLTQTAELVCSCIGQFEGSEAESECQEGLGEAEVIDELGTCIDDLLADYPNAAQPFECLVNAQYDYLECVTAEGCPGVFACENGQTIPAPWVCDGEPDCPSGSDEAGPCPAPHRCDNGETVPNGWVCDGWDDCGDESDESDCPSTCNDLLTDSFETCPQFPPHFEAAVEDQCFPSQESNPGDCLGESCDDPPPGCDDGSCASSEPLPGLASVEKPADPRRSRPHAAIKAARHTLLHR